MDYTHLEDGDGVPAGGAEASGLQKEQGSKDVPRLTIEVRNSDGDLVYETWNAEEDWSKVTLFLKETQVDIDGVTIGRSVWC